MRALVPALFGIAVLASGCHNACQKTCKEMAEYAEECGFTVSDDALKDCYKGQAGSASREDRAVCREFSDGDTIRQEWSCEDLEDYITSGSQQTEDTAADTGA